MAAPANLHAWLRQQQGSALGYHWVSDTLTCPERARLRALGVRSTAEAVGDPQGELYGNRDGMNPRDFGSILHLLRALRIIYGMGRVHDTLESWRSQLRAVTWARLATIMAAYDAAYPLPDGITYIGVECGITTRLPLREGGNRGSVYRTVRYDAVGYIPSTDGSDHELFSFELKSSSRGGGDAVLPYSAQAFSQVALWNANPHLTAKYGRMHGVVFDLMIKGTAPSADRLPPMYVSRAQQELALDFLALPSNGRWRSKLAPDGSAPRNLAACYGKWEPCEYIPLCLHGEHNNFTQERKPAVQPQPEQKEGVDAFQ